MIYLDYAAATPVRKEVQKAIDEVSLYFANPGSIHDEGPKIRELL